MAVPAALPADTSADTSAAISALIRCVFLSDGACFPPLPLPFSSRAACRALPQFLKHHRRPYDSLTWSHQIDAYLPLCPFDLRGTCADPECPLQHSADYGLSRTALLEQLLHLGGDPNRRPLGSTIQLPPGLSSEQNESAHYALTAGGRLQLASASRVAPTRQRRKLQAQTQEVPDYCLSSAAAGSAGSADSASRPFRSPLLAPANLLAMCSPEDGQPVDATYLSADGLKVVIINPVTGAGTVDGRVGRYFSGEEVGNRRSVLVEVRGRTPSTDPNEPQRQLRRLRCVLCVKPRAFTIGPSHFL